MGIFAKDQAGKKRKYLIRLRGGEFMIWNRITQEEAQKRIKAMKQAAKIEVKEFIELPQKQVLII